MAHAVNEVASVPTVSTPANRYIPFSSAHLRCSGQVEMTPPTPANSKPVLLDQNSRTGTETAFTLPSLNACNVLGPRPSFAAGNLDLARFALYAGHSRLFCRIAIVWHQSAAPKRGISSNELHAVRRYFELEQRVVVANDKRHDRRPCVSIGSDGCRRLAVRDIHPQVFVVSMSSELPGVSVRPVGRR